MVGIKLVLTMGILKVFFFEKMKIKKMVYCRNYTDCTWLFSLIAPLPG